MNNEYIMNFGWVASNYTILAVYIIMTLKALNEPYIINKIFNIINFTTTSKSKVMNIYPGRNTRNIPVMLSDNEYSPHAQPPHARVHPC